MIMLSTVQDDASAIPDDTNTSYEARPRPSIPIEARENSANVVMADTKTFGGVARRTLGILLLLVTVFLWTVGNFLTSTIFADDSYSKPYFVTYINTSAFTIFLVGPLLRRLWASHASLENIIKGRGQQDRYGSFSRHEQEAFLKPIAERDIHMTRTSSSETMSPQIGTAAQSVRLVATADSGLDMRATAKLSLEFCLLWFSANYFIAACLEYTTVASSTILMSTSSIWTLVFGALIKVEHFTARKLIGVLASLAGIILISSVDFSGNTDKNRGSFPHKSTAEIAVGNALALASAILYGLYTIFMKKRIGDESRVDMLLFFGFVGALNMIALWPGFLILHFTGVETFELPPTDRIWGIIMLMTFTSLVSDVCWAYAVLLTSPLVVTVGLSLSIPLSLVGQMIVNSQTSSALYWLGALIVFLSFIYINHESKEDLVVPIVVDVIGVEDLDPEGHDGSDER